jgi:hypothetical protein
VAVVDQNATKITLSFGAGDGTFGNSVTAPLVATSNFGSGGTGSCPNMITLGPSGLGSYQSVGAGHFTGSTHWDVVIGQSVLVSNGRNAPTQNNIVSGGAKGEAPRPAGGAPCRPSPTSTATAPPI